MGTYKPGASKGPDGLTVKQRKFCEEYIKDYNGRQAWLRVNPEAQNATASKTAQRVLAKPEAKAYINLLQKQLLEAQCVNAERIAQTLSDIAFNEEVSKTDRLKALALLQKQYGLDQIKVAADVNQTVNIKVGIEDGD